jgi:hypothetical protein
VSLLRSAACFSGKRGILFSMTHQHGRAFAALFLASLLTASGQSRSSSGDVALRDFQAIGAPIWPMPVDPRIAATLRAIEPTQIEQTIAKLVSFRNRSTLSSMDTHLPPGTGVTAAANWQRSIMADRAGVKVSGEGADATCSVTLPISKDNMIFGVRAVGAAGHRSPAVVPWPER